MIDHRLREKNAYLLDMDRRIAEASKACEEPWFPSTRLALKNCFRMVLDATPVNPIEDDLILLSALSEAARTALASVASLPVRVVGEVDAALASANTSGEGVANWLIGLSLADATAEGMETSGAFQQAVNLGCQDDVRLSAFIKGLEEPLRRSSSSLINGFVELIDRVAAFPEKSIMSAYQEALAHQIASWAQEVDVAELWSGPEWSSLNMHFDEMPVLQAVCTARPVEFLALCERMKLPPLVLSVLQMPVISSDFQRILDLLSIADPITDGANAVWNRKLAAPLLLSVAVDHLQELGATFRDEQPLAAADEIKAMVDRLTDACLARPDGRFLISHWARHLVWQAGLKGNDAHFDVMFTAVIRSMAKAGISLPELESVQPWNILSSQHSDSSSTADQRQSRRWSRGALDTLLLAALIDADRPEFNIASDRDALLSSFRQHLMAGTDALEDFRRGRLPNWRHFHIALLYLPEPDVRATWILDWNSLAAQRRQAIHWIYAEQRNAPFPSLFLARVGLALIDWHLDGKGIGKEGAFPLWQTLFDATVPLATHWSLQDDQWRDILLGLFARFPLVAKSTENGMMQTEVWAHLDRLGGDDNLVLSAVASMSLNGLPEDALTLKLGAPSDLLNRADRAIQWDSTAGPGSLSAGVLTFWKKVPGSADVDSR